MGLEDLSKPIEVESIEEQTRRLRKRLIELQFKYIERVASGELRPLDTKVGKESSFSNLLETYTDLRGIIMDSYFSRKGDSFDKNQFESFLSNLLDEISALFETSKKNWIIQAESLIKGRLDEIGAEKKQENSYIEENRKKHKIGPISYKVEDEIEEQALLNEGIKGVAGISIHFDPFYMTRSLNKNEDLRIDPALQELAERIITEYPETQVVYGKSWMANANSIKRRGFRVVELDSKDTEYTGDTFWGQFIDNTGQINNSSVEEFFKNGIPEYKVMIAYMPIVEFLKRYLPESKRGTIELKEINHDLAIRFKEERKIMKSEITEKWNYINKDEIYRIFSSLPLMQGFLATKEGAGFDVFFAEVKIRGESVASIKNNPNFAVYEASFLGYEKSLVYKPIKVQI